MAIVYTTSTQRPATNLVRIAHVAAAGRVQAEREAEVARQARIWEISRTTGQLCEDNQDWCFICSRPTDHTGEHTPEQIARWLNG